MGINAYPAGAKLAGCVNDIELFRDIVAENSFSVANCRQLRDRQATGSRILNALFDLSMADADVLIFEYSGHGTAVKDKTGDEAYGVDAAIVPVDFQKSGLITDDQLATFSDLALSRGKKPILFLDSCYSGYAQRAFDFLTPHFIHKALKRDKPRALPDTFINSAVRVATQDNKDFSLLPVDRKRKPVKPTGELVNFTDYDGVAVETARWNETAADAWIAEWKKYQGSGTVAAMFQGWKRLGKGASYLEVAGTANEWLSTRGYSQRIVLEGSTANLNLPFLT